MAASAVAPLPRILTYLPPLLFVGGADAEALLDADADAPPLDADAVAAAAASLAPLAFLLPRLSSSISVALAVLLSPSFPVGT